jgi:hypothetical protein
MNPAEQDNARKDLVSSLARTKTGDAETDSLMSAEVRRQAKFAGTTGQKPAQSGISNPFRQVGDAIKQGIHWLTTYDPYKKGQ